MDRTAPVVLVSAERNEQELRAFLAEPVVHVLPADDESSLHYAEIVTALRRAGTPLPTNDVWIAAIAAGTAAEVLTFDDRFRRIERVRSRVLSR